MFHKVLVAVDNSTFSQTVFEQALDLGKATGATLMLLHVLSSEEEGSPYVPPIGVEYYPMLTSVASSQEEWLAYEGQCLDMLRTYSEQASAHGVKAEFTQTSGNPGRMICHMAQMWECDLILMGRRGHSGLSELLLGSVSNYVLHHAPCSVLTIQGQSPVEATDTPEQQAAAVS